MTTIDMVKPDGKWQFDGNVTACFDDMLSRSIPEYAAMRRAVFDLGCRFVQPRTDIVDLGCSRGEALSPFVDRFGVRNRFVGIDVSEPMLDAARERFTGYIDRGVVDVANVDLRDTYPAVLASLTLAVLTIQFTPIEYRQRIMQNIYSHTADGGAFILVEKVLGSDADTDAVLVRNYYAMKEANGYSQDDIARKRRSLEGVLVPLTAAWNEELLRGAGFRSVECFWRHLNFAAWIAIK